MAHGTPVLTSRNSFMPEVAGSAGLLVDPLQIQSIQSGLEEFITNQNLRTRLSENAWQNVAKYNWDNAANQLLFIFKEAIDARE